MTLQLRRTSRNWRQSVRRHSTHYDVLRAHGFNDDALQSVFRSDGVAIVRRQRVARTDSSVWPATDWCPVSPRSSPRLLPAGSAGVRRTLWLCRRWSFRQSSQTVESHFTWSVASTFHRIATLRTQAPQAFITTAWTFHTLVRLQLFYSHVI